MIKIKPHLLTVLLTILMLGTSTLQADVGKGLQWLSAQQSQTGDITTNQDLAIGSQNISETLKAFGLPIDETFNQANALAYLERINSLLTEHLTRRIISDVKAK